MGVGNMSYIWPIALVVVSNVLYQICAKSIPKDMNVMASMTVTYLVGAICSAVMYFVMERDGNLLREYSKLNAAPVLLGVCVVGLEIGIIYAYKIGWPVSTATMVQSCILSAALIVVGALLYHEAITWNKLIGVALCLAGLYFINK